MFLKAVRIDVIRAMLMTINADHSYDTQTLRLVNRL